MSRVRVVTNIMPDGKAVQLETWVDGKPLAHAILDPEAARNVADSLTKYAEMVEKLRS